jgi:hypothetical protein
MHNCNIFASIVVFFKELLSTVCVFLVSEDPYHRPSSACCNLSKGLLQEIINSVAAESQKAPVIALELEQYTPSLLTIVITYKPVFQARIRQVVSKAARRRSIRIDQRLEEILVLAS